MLRRRPHLTSFLFLGAGLALFGAGASASSTQVELTPYTKQDGYALITIDDQAQPGQVEFSVELPAASKGRVVGIFINFLDGRPADITPASVTGPGVGFVEVGTKNLGNGINVSPSPSERAKGMFDLGIAVVGSGPVTFRIENPNGQLSVYSFGPFAAVVEYEGAEGPKVAKLYGVPVLPAARKQRNTTRGRMESAQFRKRLARRIP